MTVALGTCNRPGRLHSPGWKNFRMEEFQGGDPMRRRLVLILSLSGLLVASASVSVEATYPGTNDGRLAFGMIVGGNVDIYSVLPNGNDLRRLTTDASFDACASYSPDGKEIAFCSTRSGASEIWKMKQNGTQQEQVTHLSGNVTFPDFSPDGSRIVFGGSAGGSNPDLWVVNSDGSGATRLTSGPDVDVFPAWSPDGSKIAYNSGDDIWIMDANGSDQHPLFVDPSTIEFGPAWSPVGDQIAFVSFPLGNLGARTIYVIDPDGTGKYAVHPGPGPQIVPAWQP